MKALKEKRISLRSLLGRSLVILSLFALVFSSCSDSSDDSAPTASGKVAANIWVKAYPVRDQYEGCKIDLTGLVIGVEYTDGSIVDFDYRNVKVSPERAFGSFGAIGFINTWVPYDGYTINFGEATVGLVQSASGWFDIKPIVRTEAINVVTPDKDVGLGEEYPGNYWLANGLQLTGTTPFTAGGNSSVYVDDSPNFGGLTLEANYVGGDKKQIDGLSANDPFFQWIIAPRYDNGQDTGTGDLFITVGQAPGMAAPLGTDWWPITATQPLKEVYHVKALEVVDAPDIKFFYFEDETNGKGLGTDGETEFWVARAGDVKLKMTYSNGVSKEFTVAQGYRMNEVWWNPPFNPPGAHDWLPPIAIRGIQSNATAPLVTSSVNYARNRTPKITIYYRGYRVNLDVPVLTRLDSLLVTPKEDLNINMVQREVDNDYREAISMNATKFATMVDVVARFTAYSNSEFYGDYPLSFNEPRTSHESTDTIGVSDPNQPFVYYRSGFPHLEDVGLYSMDFGKHPWWDSEWVNGSGLKVGRWDTNFDDMSNPGPDPITSNLYIDAFGVCSAANNNGRERQVTFYYTAPNDQNGAPYPTGISRRSANNRLPVTWEGIRTRL